MKLTILKPTEVDVRYASMTFYCDYPECFTFNGKECETVEDLCNLPIKADKNDPDSHFDITINIDTGEVYNWPKGNTLSLFIKLRDEGEYYLLDEHFDEIQWLEFCYVPSLFCVNEQGYGDYASLSINENGFIEGWETHIQNVNVYKEFFENED